MTAPPFPSPRRGRRARSAAVPRGAGGRPPAQAGRSDRLPSFPALTHGGWANAVTSLVALLGLGGCLYARIHPRLALTLLGLATALDRLDGMLARRLGEGSPFGAQLDSLADALAFSALPAALVLALARASALGAVGAATFCLAGLWRLAYFNVHGLAQGRTGARYTGVPTTVAASWLLVAAPFLIRLRGVARDGTVVAFAAGLACLMAARLPYPKDGLATRMLYGLVPAAVLLSWLWWPR
jgi:CDP-diacylglycerol--serine O-phosphatidyltransferase